MCGSIFNQAGTQITGERATASSAILEIELSAFCCSRYYERLADFKGAIHEAFFRTSSVSAPN